MPEKTYNVYLLRCPHGFAHNDILVSAENADAANHILRNITPMKVSEENIVPHMVARAEGIISNGVFFE